MFNDRKNLKKTLRYILKVAVAHRLPRYISKAFIVFLIKKDTFYALSIKSNHTNRSLLTQSMK